jgi:exodeoxyribonuclease VII large subunit
MAGADPYRTNVARRPFDPRLARGGLFDPAPAAAPRADPAPRADAPPAADAITVTEASALIRRAIESAGRLRIVGEVSNFSNRQHWYFTLKDGECQLDCVMWASSTASAACRPADGLEVVVEGTPTHYGPRGRTQLVVRSVERLGAGTLQQQFEELCRTLRAQGYFDEARKRPLPAYPRAIAVVTSAQGAALQDVLRTARLRAPFVRILAVDVPVQGDAAAPAIARAVDALDRRAAELGLDAVIVTRGGGSIEDLWAFNERAVADSIFRARIPIVAAIGHESDVTVAELVADRRASTPTAAVMLLLPDRDGMRQQSDHLHDRLRFLVQRRVHDARVLAERLARHPGLRSPTAGIAARRAELDRAWARLGRAAAARLSSDAARLSECRARLERVRPAARHAVAGERLAALEARLRSAVRRASSDRRRRLEAADRGLRILGPGETLARGWSLTFDAEGRLVRRTSDAPPGSAISTRLADGVVRSRVE